MEILKHENIPSTSLQAAEYLRAGKSAPFAVIAGQQTGGRGRRGRSWSSPPGGIYLSLVLPPPAMETALLGNLPLWAGVQTARWLQSKFNFRVALKWPNDLLFDGRKLGGILVESGFEGGKQGPVVFGIGINCLNKPEVSGSEPDAVALSEICALSDHPELLARDLINFIVASWSSMNLEVVGQDFMAWSPPVYRMWIGRKSPGILQATAIGTDGSLHIRTTTPASPAVILHSADHEYKVPTKSTPLPMLLADIGNTAVKILWIESPWSLVPRERHRFFHSDDSSGLRDALTLIGKQMPDHHWPFLLAGVAPEQIQKVAKIAAEVGLVPITIEKRPVKWHGGTYPLNELGIDRLAAMEGWLTGVTDPEEVGVIVSCGTALTIDVIRANGLHLGGVIAPGITLGGLALNQHTGLLPLVQSSDLGGGHEDVLGHSTRSAIAAGLAGAAVGLVERIFADLIKNNKVTAKHLRLILTGGDRVLASQFFPAATVCEDLVFHGLQAMAGGGMLQLDLTLGIRGQAPLFHT